MRLKIACALLLSVAPAKSDPVAETINQCLSCHIRNDGQLDIVGVKALQALPDGWSLQFEDAFDLDADGISGQVQFVNGYGYPLIAKWGSQLAAARFEDFALIAASAHNVELADDATIKAVKKAFEDLSPAPTSPFTSQAELEDFQDAGCSRCHVTQSYEMGDQIVMPFSDFLLHDLGDGKAKRTSPLWGYQGDIWKARHLVEKF